MTIDQYLMGNMLGGIQNFGPQMQNAMQGIFNTNVLNSANVQNARAAQAQTARGYYDALGETNASQSQSQAIIEQARQQAQAQAQQAAAQIAAAQAQANAMQEVARLQSQSALEQERLRQSTAQGKVNAMGPLLSAVLGIFGQGGGQGSGGGMGGVQTNYGAGVNLGSGAQPTNVQQFRQPLAGGAMVAGARAPQSSMGVLRR